MPNGTLVNLSRSSFIRTPPTLAEQIVKNLLFFPPTTKGSEFLTILDPTVGDGDFLLPTRELPQARLFGVEISADRTQNARRLLAPRRDHPDDALIQIYQSAFEGVSIPPASISLILTNPPYMVTEGRRLEFLIISKSGQALVPGGVMVAILPARTAWDGTMVNHFLKWYDRVSVYKFPHRTSPEQESPFEQYTQIVVIGVRRREPRETVEDVQKKALLAYRWRRNKHAKENNGDGEEGDGEWDGKVPPPEIPMSPLTIGDRYEVPYVTTIPKLTIRKADESTILALIEHGNGEAGNDEAGYGAHMASAWKAATQWDRDKHGIGTGQPAMPLTGAAHVAAEAMTGILDGNILYSPKGEPHLITAFVGKEWVSVPVDPDRKQQLLDQGVVEVRVRQEMDKPMLGSLNITQQTAQYYQGEEVFTFLEPWMGILASQVAEKRRPIYELNPPEWMMRVMAHLCQDKQLPNAEFAGLAPAQQHRVYAMYQNICGGSGRTLLLSPSPSSSSPQGKSSSPRRAEQKRQIAMQGEPGTGKTRLAATTGALMAYQWRYRLRPELFADTILSQHEESVGQQREATTPHRQPDWVKRLRRAWLKNPRTLSLLELTPEYDPNSGQVIGYQSLTTGKILPPEQCGPKALPLLVTTPKKVSEEYGKEVRAAWPQCEVILILKHTDIVRWLTRCAESDAPAVMGIIPHSLSTDRGTAWYPAAREKQTAKRVLDTDPSHIPIEQREPVRDRDRNVIGYRLRATGELITTIEKKVRFYCPDCGKVISAIGDKEKKKREEKLKKKLKQQQEQEREGQVASADHLGIELEDERDIVTSKTFFTTNQRWCDCPTHSRNRSDARYTVGREGRKRQKAALWTDARVTRNKEKKQVREGQHDFRWWLQERERPILNAVRYIRLRRAEFYTSSLHELRKKYEPHEPKEEEKGKLWQTAHDLAFEGGVDLSLLASERTGKDSFSPFEYLARFYKGCVALTIVDESHNGRGRDTDIAQAHHQAMRAAQTAMMTSGTHFGGDVEKFYRYWFRFHPQFWLNLGLKWEDHETAVSRYGSIQEWVTEREDESNKGSGNRNVSTNIIAAPGLSASLIPHLLQDMCYLTVLDVGAYMPPRIEIPVVVPMADPAIRKPLDEAIDHFQEVERQALHLLQEKALLLGEKGDASQIVSHEERIQQVARIAAQEEEMQAQVEQVRLACEEAKAWYEERDLAGAYRKVVDRLDDLAKARNSAARMAKGTIPKWFSVLPCVSPFEVWENYKNKWGDITGRHRMIETPVLTTDHRYPMERKLCEIVEKELAEGRRVMIYTEQNEKRSMAGRLSLVLAQYHPWSLPNNVDPEDRQAAILKAEASGHKIFLVQYSRVNEGLNLQTAIDTIIWYEMALNLFMLDQASRRCWRLGKEEEVRIYYMVYAGTAGHVKLRKLGQQSGAAAAFSGEVAQGALVEHADADKTTLARLSSKMAQGLRQQQQQQQQRQHREEEEDLLSLMGVNDTDELAHAFQERAQELADALKKGRSWLGYTDELPDRYRTLMQAMCSQQSHTHSIWLYPTLPPVARTRQARADRIRIAPARLVPPPPLQKNEEKSALPPPLLPPSLPLESGISKPERGKIGEKAILTFGSRENIQLLAKAHRKKGGKSTRKKQQIEVKLIPALTPGEGLWGEGSGGTPQVQQRQEGSIISLSLWE